MSTPYRVRLFGKVGCSKCKVLKKRLAKLLDNETWQDVDWEYCDIETEEGIIRFCEAECLNPQRIPALLVLRREDEADTYEPVPNPDMGRSDALGGKARLYQHLGVQTDYGPEGDGTIGPALITGILERARG